MIYLYKQTASLTDITAIEFSFLAKGDRLSIYNLLRFKEKASQAASELYIPHVDCYTTLDNENYLVINNSSYSNSTPRVFIYYPINRMLIERVIQKQSIISSARITETSDLV